MNLLSIKSLGIFIEEVGVAGVNWELNSDQILNIKTYSVEIKFIL